MRMRKRRRWNEFKELCHILVFDCLFSADFQKCMFHRQSVPASTKFFLSKLLRRFDIFKKRFDVTFQHQTIVRINMLSRIVAQNKIEKEKVRLEIM